MGQDPGEELDGDGNFDLTGGRHIEWDSMAPLPTNFTAERAVIQLQNFDFTWMITAVAAPPAQVSMDVVVFQGRQFSVHYIPPAVITVSPISISMTI